VIDSRIVNKHLIWTQTKILTQQYRF
jgi:hypothetical protein